jgi:hypothetical protein
MEKGLVGVCQLTLSFFSHYFLLHHRCAVLLGKHKPKPTMTVDFMGFSKSVLAHAAVHVYAFGGFDGTATVLSKQYSVGVAFELA